VPEHVGVTANSTGAPGRDSVGDLQQIVPGQSVSSAQVFGHVAAQRPLQQSASVDPAQSDEVVQALGQGWNAGFTQAPPALRLGSSEPRLVQHTSPFEALHCESVVQATGHSSSGVQKGFL
jgi:hypothetical protein